MDDAFDWAPRDTDLAAAAQDDGDFFAIMAGKLLAPTTRIAVDFGCGSGGMAVAMKQHSDDRGYPARIVGLDTRPQAYADTQRTYPDVSFAQSSFEDPPDRIVSAIGGAADLIWVRGALHHAADEVEALNCLRQALRTGGTLAIAEGGTTVANLPEDLNIGDPGLQKRLDEAVFARIHAQLGATHDQGYGWPVVIATAGLHYIRTHHVLFGTPQPLGGADMDYVLARFGRYVDWARTNLDSGDLRVWERLLDPDDHEWLGHRHDLYYVPTASVHLGERTA